MSKSSGIKGLRQHGSTVTIGSPSDGSFISQGSNPLSFISRKDSAPIVHTDSPIESTLGGQEDPISMATPIPLALIPGPASAPLRIPYKMPLQEYMDFLPTAVLALSAAIIQEVV